MNSRFHFLVLQIVSGPEMATVAFLVDQYLKKESYTTLMGAVADHAPAVHALAMQCDK